MTISDGRNISTFPTIYTSKTKTTRRLFSFLMHHVSALPKLEQWVEPSYLERAAICVARKNLISSIYVNLLCLYEDAFMVCPPPNTGDLEELFRHEVFQRLKAEGKTIVAAAVERDDKEKQIGRIRLQVSLDYSANSLENFITENVQPGSHIATDSWGRYSPNFKRTIPPCADQSIKSG
jgi:hypothetical protein